jgi:hypothetical protein
MRTIRSYLLDRDYPLLRDLGMLTVIFGNAFFLLLGRGGLFEPDEGRYAEIPREMLERSDFITPTLDYVHYFEKPPLHYWLTAFSFKLFGLCEFAARFTGALAGLLGVLLVYHTGRKMFGRREGLFAALILGSSTGFVAQSRINLTDKTLTLCLSAALCCFIIAADDRERHKVPYYYLLYLFSALAVLAKGLIGLVFPVGIIALYLVATSRRHLVKEMRLGRGVILFLAVAAPWFVLASLRNPGFARFFFIHEHLERFLTTTHSRYQPVWFFIPILLLTMFPWSLYGARAITRAWKERRQRNGDQLLFLLIWALLIFIFFSASHSKLIPYILPVFPPLALLMGKMFSDLADGAQERTFGPEHALLGGLLAVMTVAAVVYPHIRDLAPVLAGTGLVRPGSSLLTKQPILSPAGGVVLACLTGSMGAVTWLASRKRDILILFAVVCFGSYLLETIGLHMFMNGLEFKKSSKELALLAKQAVAHDGWLTSYGYEQSLPFYTGRRVVVVGERGELEFGSRQGDQTAWFIEEPGFMKLWRGQRQVVMLLKRADYERISPRLVPAATVLGQKGKKMLICNRTAAASTAPTAGDND